MLTCEILGLAIRSAAQVFESCEKWKEMAILISQARVVSRRCGCVYFLGKREARKGDAGQRRGQV